MNTLPKFLEDWQIKDIADNNVGGYKYNPVSITTQSIRNTCNTLNTLLSASSNTSGNDTVVISAVQGTTPEITTLFSTMNSSAASVGGVNGGLFIEHTDRISGVTPIGADSATKPYYDIALNAGQTIMFITRQSDNVANNSPVLGCFTSLLIKDSIQDFSIQILPYYNTINDSITISSNTVFGNSAIGEGNTTTIIRTSNLSFDAVTAMQNTIVTIDTTLSTRRVHDEQFYINSKTIMNEFITLRAYSTMGTTANNLCQNYVGSEKLLSRINS